MKRFHRNEAGQALMEYYVLFPIAVTLLVIAGGLTGWLTGAYQKTVDAFEPVEICEMDEAAEEDNGPTVAEMGDHKIELVSVSYNPSTDETAVVYEVTSGPKPSISHWVLGLPASVAANIIDESEKYEWTDSDPKTGVAGIKFDTGYEVASNEGDLTFASNSDNGSIVLASFSTGRFAAAGDDEVQEGEETEFDTGGPVTDSREIALLLSGNYEWNTTTVSIKAGNDIHISTITAPVTVVIQTEPDAEGCQ